VVDYARSLASDPLEESHVETPAEILVKMGQSVRGRLGFGDALMPRTIDNSSKASFNDVYKLDLTALANVRIGMNGNGACRPHLTLVDGSGKKIEGDMGGTNFPSTIVRKLSAGRYSIWAGASSIGEVCSYDLKITAKD
jgi:hypothetical protein